MNTITSVFTNFFGAGTTETYITWGAFERILNYYCNGFDIPTPGITYGDIALKKAPTSFSLFREDATSKLPIPPKGIEKCYDSSGVELRANPNVNSSDPRICIIPGSSFARR